jgi:hypothetical protein
VSSKQSLRQRIAANRVAIAWVSAGAIAAALVIAVFLVGHSWGWFGTATPTAADWLTATSSAVLALAAPVSIWLVGRQIRDAQKSSEDERNYAITPYLLVTLSGTRRVTPHDLPENMFDRERWRLQEGATEYAAHLHVEAVGEGAALSVRPSFLPFLPVKLTGYLEATNYPVTITPTEILHVRPGVPKTFVVTWVQPMPYADKKSFAIFMLELLFRNALGRQFSVTYICTITAPDKLTLEHSGPVQVVDHVTPEQLLPLIHAVSEMKKAK